MLYRNYQIKIWKTEWVGKTIHGVNYSLNHYSFCGEEDVVKNHKYAALIWRINPSHSVGIYGGSTPLIALDLAKFAIGLEESNTQRFDMIERVRNWDKKCLETSLKK
jgi:hypothetical protein